MGRSRGLRRLSTRALPLACLAAALAVPAAAAAVAIAPKHHGPLAAELKRLAQPSLAARPPRAQARALGLPPSGPGSLVREGGRVLVEVGFGGGTLAAAGDVRAAGGRVLAASRRYQRLTASVAPESLPQVAAIPGVAAVSPVRAPILFATECEGGSVISQGVGQLDVEAARAEFGVDGTGITVGVLSDSFDAAQKSADGEEPIATKAADDVVSKDLPGLANTCPGQQLPVKVLSEFEPGPEGGEETTDEGRAMLQIVHDMAPGASLAFASAFNGELAFANAIKALAKPVIGGGAGAKVIVDDVGYFEEPFFQDGPVAVAVNEVTQAGATYVSAAGNDSLLDGEGDEIASWEAPEYRDAGSCPPAIADLAGYNGKHCLDFDPGAASDRTFGIRVEPEETLSLDLQWAEPWHGVETDLDAFLLDSEGRLLASAGEDNVAEERPIEILQWENQSPEAATVQLVVNRFSGLSPRLKFILLQNGGGVTGTEYPASGGGDVVGPSVFGHAGSARALAVGAVPFTSTTHMEDYSSRGPVTHYFGPVKGATPAAPLPSPEVISKPDVAATDCVATTFFATKVPGGWRFCGTSAAGPHAAGIAALIRASEGSATASQVAEWLEGTGRLVGAEDACGAGGGLIDALAALEAANGELSPTTPAACSPPDASGPVVRAPGDWGSEEPRPAPAPPAPGPAASAGPAPTAPRRAAPDTFIVKHPRRVTRIRGRRARLAFRFRSDEANAGFSCSVDGRRYRPCAASLSRRFPRGRHSLAVRAVGPTGLVDPTPAVYRFRVAPLA